MLEKTVSQKIARAFEIVDYFLLIPAGLGLFLAIITFSWFTVAIGSVFALGCVLLVGYIKHSRGRLNEKYIPALWISSAAYNALLLLPVILYAGYFWMDLDFNSVRDDRELWKFLVGSLLISGGYLAAIGLSVKAYLFERNQKYR